MTLSPYRKVAQYVAILSLPLLLRCISFSQSPLLFALARLRLTFCSVSISRRLVTYRGSITSLCWDQRIMMLTTFTLRPEYPKGTGVDLFFKHAFLIQKQFDSGTFHFVHFISRYISFRSVLFKVRLLSFQFSQAHLES